MSWKPGDVARRARSRLRRPSLAGTAAFLGRWTLRIGLPITFAAALLTLFPYHATAGGVDFQVRGSLLANRGFSADTTVGNWIFPHVDLLPVGVHIAPVDLDLVTLASAASADPAAYAEQLRDDLAQQVPGITAWLLGELLLGILLGLGAAALINLAIRQARGLPRREHELRLRVRQLGAAGIVVILLAGVAVVTYEPHWARRSHLTGTVAALQLFPSDLNDYYQQGSKALDVFDAIAVIQSSLAEHVAVGTVPDTAYSIMFISDMHLAGNYPVVMRYAESFGVDLIINTGDESEFGTRAEMTSGYLNQLRAVTARTPMIWLAGNHDSPATAAVMRTIPGVTVLGRKTSAPDAYRVSAQAMSAYGLTVAAVPDPRVYGGPGAYGADADKDVLPLERSATEGALQGVPSDLAIDIFATHEPVAAVEAVKELPGQIRQTNTGHVHAQNKDDQIQGGGPINLVEGSTGAGGLDNLGRKAPIPPVEFSIESVAADCQFTKIVRFQITGTAPISPEDATQGLLPHVTASTHYFRPQDIATDRLCSVTQGLSEVRNLGRESALPTPS